MCRFDETALPPLTASVPEARRWVRDRLTAWELPDSLDGLLLATTEMVSNAVLHARTGLDLSLSIAGGVLELDVVDLDPRPPLRRQPDSHEVRGRGVALLDALASQWGVDGRTDGKTVWFQMAAPQGWRYARLCVCEGDHHPPDARLVGSGRTVVIMDPTLLPGKGREAR